MKRIPWFLAILLLLLFPMNGRIEASAANTGFSTETLPESAIDTVLKNVTISVLKEEPQKTAIECFDVNENGLIALGGSDFEKKTVCVYTIDGSFQYGYSFTSSGSFGLEWDTNNLLIYFVRSGISIAVNPMGEIESVLEISNTSENNSYWNHSVFSTKREVEGTEYTLKNDMGILNWVAASYSQLIAKDPTGAETILYDANSVHLAKTLTVCIIFIGFFLAAVLGLARLFIQSHRNKRN